MNQEDWILQCEQAIAHLMERIEHQQGVVDRHKAAGRTFAAGAAEALLHLMDDALAAHCNRLRIHLESLDIMRSYRPHARPLATPPSAPSPAFGARRTRRAGVTTRGEYDPEPKLDVIA